jgi:hypothetical protein
MAISSVLPGKATFRTHCESVNYTWPTDESNLRDVTKGAHLRPIQREARMALVSIGFQVSGQALRLYRHAALQQNLCARIQQLGWV